MIDQRGVFEFWVICGLLSYFACRDWARKDKEWTVKTRFWVAIVSLLGPVVLAFLIVACLLDLDWHRKLN